MNQLAVKENSSQEFLVQNNRYTANQVVEQVNLIKEIVSRVMVEHQHFGKIPGTTKDTLLKPGAEMLCLTFRLTAEYDIKQTEKPDGHREYLVTCALMHMTSGICYAKASGICSTMETKYRYRKVSDFTVTDIPVPKEWWDKKDVSLIGGKGHAVKKVDEVWRVVKLSSDGSKQENPDIADTYNTVLKMAMKRAYVSATLSATCASDIFTQDLEDMNLESEDVTPKNSANEKSYNKTGAHQKNNNYNNKQSSNRDGLFNKAKSIVANAKNMDELKKVSTYTSALNDHQKSELKNLVEDKRGLLKKQFEEKNQSVSNETEAARNATDAEFREGLGSENPSTTGEHVSE